MNRSIASTTPALAALLPWRLIRAARSLTRRHWQWALGLALFFSLTGTLLIQLVRETTAGWQAMLLECLLCEVPVAVIALLGIAFVEQRDRGTQPPLLAYLLVVIVAAACGGLLYFGAFAAANEFAALILVLPSDRSMTAATLFPEWLARSLGWTFTLGGAVFTYVYLRNAARMRRHLANAEARSAETRRALLANELAATQALVEPGFLFDTLKLVEQRHEIDPAAGDRLLEALIAYLRAALPLLESEPSTLGRQGELVRAYLQIERASLGSLLEYDVNVPEELGHVPFPPLLLLPLVEAAIRQGIEPHDRGGRVALVARGAAGLLELTVTDDGATRVVESQGGIAAVRERLAGLYGERGRLDLIAIPGGGMTARIEVPYEADPRRPR
jgi:hypothetical protein